MITELKCPSVFLLILRLPLATTTTTLFVLMLPLLLYDDDYGNMAWCHIFNTSTGQSELRPAVRARVFHTSRSFVAVIIAYFFRFVPYRPM